MCLTFTFEVSEFDAEIKIKKGYNNLGEVMRESWSSQFTQNWQSWLSNSRVDQSLT